MLDYDRGHEVCLTDAKFRRWVVMIALSWRSTDKIYLGSKHTAADSGTSLLWYDGWEYEYEYWQRRKVSQLGLLISMIPQTLFFLVSKKSYLHIVSHNIIRLSTTSQYTDLVQRKQLIQPGFITTMHWGLITTLIYNCSGTDNATSTIASNQRVFFQQTASITGMSRFRNLISFSINVKKYSLLQS